LSLYSLSNKLQLSLAIFPIDVLSWVISASNS